MLLIGTLSASYYETKQKAPRNQLDIGRGPLFPPNVRTIHHSASDLQWYAQYCCCVIASNGLSSSNVPIMTCSNGYSTLPMHQRTLHDGGCAYSNSTSRLLRALVQYIKRLMPFQGSLQKTLMTLRWKTTSQLWSIPTMPSQTLHTCDPVSPVEKRDRLSLQFRW